MSGAVTIFCWGALIAWICWEALHEVLERLADRRRNDIYQRERWAASTLYPTHDRRVIKEAPEPDTAGRSTHGGQFHEHHQA
jgi:hypothetical protein